MPRIIESRIENMNLIVSPHCTIEYISIYFSTYIRYGWYLYIHPLIAANHFTNIIIINKTKKNNRWWLCFHTFNIKVNNIQINENVIVLEDK